MEPFKQVERYLKENFVFTKLTNPKEIAEPISKAVENGSKKTAEVVKEAIESNKAMAEIELGQGVKISLPIQTKIKGETGEKGEQGDPGKDGKDADEERVIREVLKRIPKERDLKKSDEDRIVTAILKKIKTPADGKDAVIDYDFIVREAAAIFEGEYRNLKPLTEFEIREIVRESIGKTSMSEKDKKDIVKMVKKEVKVEPISLSLFQRETTMGSIADVNLSNPTNGQALKFNSTTGKWENGTVSGGSGAWGSITGTLADQTDLQTALDGKVNDTGDETIAGVKTFSSDPLIPDEAYDATAWNGSLEPPTKNAVRDKIETLQPLDTELTALAGLTSAADKGIQFTGAGTAGTYDLTAAGKALLDDADASAQRTTLGLGTMATETATNYVAKSLFDAHTILQATSDNTPAALTVGEQTVVGRATGGNITALAIDPDLSSVSASDDTIPSAKATKAALDLKAPLASPSFTGTVTLPTGLTGVIRADSGVVSVDSDVTDIVAAGTSTAAGKLELATDAETVTGTDTARATTPANITAKMSAPGAIGNTTASTGKFTTVETTGNIELGHASDTTLSRSAAGVLAVEGVVIPSISSTNTLTNKRVTPRTGTTTSSATPTINTDNVDYYSLTAQAADITSFTTNLSGTPTDGQKLWISITGTAARAITWGSSFEASTIALPTTTVSTNRLDVGFIWNAATSKWRCIGTA